LFEVELHILLLLYDAKILLAFILAASFPIRASNFAFSAAHYVLLTDLPWSVVALHEPYNKKVSTRSGQLLPFYLNPLCSFSAFCVQFVMLRQQVCSLKYAKKLLFLSLLVLDSMCP